MKHLFFIIFLFLSNVAISQELFVYTEPASNMASRSIGFRATNNLMYDRHEQAYNYHLLPEVMWGISKHLMVHAEGFLSNRNKNLVAEGGGLYLKYRFFSIDDVHSHLRLATFIRASYNNSDIHQEAIDLNGHNTGYETGIVATKLQGRVAVSATGSYIHAMDNGQSNKLPPNVSRNAVAYTLSAGRLMLPKEYTDFNQTNVNLMLEALAQTNVNSGKTFVDVAPSVQFIFMSRMRLDLGYRFPLVSGLSRTASRGFLLRFEYNIFNAYK